MNLDDVLVLDGGLSNALEDRGLDLSSDLWTARLLLDDPTQVAAVHRDYYLAGAPTWPRPRAIRRACRAWSRPG